MNLNKAIRFWRGLFFRNQEEIYLGIAGIILGGIGFLVVSFALVW